MIHITLVPLSCKTFCEKDVPISCVIKAIVMIQKASSQKDWRDILLAITLLTVTKNDVKVQSFSFQGIQTTCRISRNLAVKGDKV
jgi:hypothetical protein